MNKFSKYAFIMLGLLSFAACSDDDKQKEEPELKPKGEPVNFTVTDDEDGANKSSVVLRTAYGDKNESGWTIKWVDNDPVQINKYGDAQTNESFLYKVKKKSNESFGDLVATGDDSHITWTTGYSGKELFSAVYPASAQAYPEKNPVKAIDKHVIVNYELVQTREVKGDALDYKMENLVMVGFKEQAKTKDPINLKLTPVTSTLEITVKGRTDEEVSITGITVQIDNSECFINKKGQVKYEYVSDDKFKAIPWDKSECDPTVNFMCNIDNNEYYTKIAANGKLTFTVFIPGLKYDANKCKVVVRAGANAKSFYLKALKENVRYKINTPNLPSEVNPSGWMEDLDDNVLLRSLSIPGSFHTCAYDTWSSSAVEIQNRNMTQQLNYGVRAFHMNVYKATSNSSKTGSSQNSYIWGRRNSGYALNLGPYDIAKSVNDFLKNHKKDFVVLVLGPDANTASNWTQNLNNCFNNIRTDFPGLLLDNPPMDITVKDARGHLIIFTHNYIHTANPMFYRSGYFITKWPQDADRENGNFTSILQEQVNYNGETINIFDANMTTGAWNTPNQICGWIMGNMKKSGWRITNCGYSTVYPTAIDGYAQGAADLMRANFKEIVRGHKGNTGIVLFSFIGEEYVPISDGGRNKAHGQILPQLIADKNMLYPVERK